MSLLDNPLDNQRGDGSTDSITMAQAMFGYQRGDKNMEWSNDLVHWFPVTSLWHITQSKYFRKARQQAVEELIAVRRTVEILAKPDRRVQATKRGKKEKALTVLLWVGWLLIIFGCILILIFAANASDPSMTNTNSSLTVLGGVIDGTGFALIVSGIFVFIIRWIIRESQ